MSIGKILPVVTQVLSNSKVIITAIIVFVYMDLVCYIVRYKKRPPRPKKKAEAAPPSADAAAAAPAAETPAPETQS